MVQLGDIDKTDDRPPYRQIAAALREAITAGRLAPDDRLPSQSELVECYDVARRTARRSPRKTPRWRPGTG
ncbi:MAG: GntR family transcriptional regulator [Pseudonocardiaceae bacterium]